MLLGGSWALSASRPGRFNPEKEVRFPLNRKKNGLQSEPGRFGENFLGSVRFRTLDRKARSPLTLVWFQLCFNNCLKCQLGILRTVLQNLGSNEFGEDAGFSIGVLTDFELKRTK